jgi:hypothetical protein
MSLKSELSLVTVADLPSVLKTPTCTCEIFVTSDLCLKVIICMGRRVILFYHRRQELKFMSAMSK